MSEVVQTLEGWYALHDFRTIDWTSWKLLSQEDRNQAKDELFSLMQEWSSVEENKLGSFGIYSVLGHKADLMFIHLRPTLEELIELENTFNKTIFAECTTSDYSYVSVVELSGYLAKPDVDPEQDPYVQGRLKPTLPKLKYASFYPMSKKREGNDNWYMLPMEDRREMMRSHGLIGRSYSGKIIQLICGSVGLDDWEWGVTLFSDDPVQFKKIVYEMRFDEASARYGEFGSFLVGNRLEKDQLEQLLKL